MAKNITLYDGSGQPFPSEGNGPGSNLPAGVEALIEARVNSALDNLREQNRHELQRLAREYAGKWRYVALISSAVTVVSWVVGIVTMVVAPPQIASWLATQIDTKLTEPMLQDSANRLIESKMTAFVSDKLKPLDQQAGELKATIDDMNVAIGAKQAAIEEQQKKLASQLHIQELAVAAKAGSRQSYTDLLRLKGSDVDASDLLAASLKEIELFYDADRNQFAHQTLVKAETLRDPGFAVDEVVFTLRREPKLIEAAINTLSRLKSKASVKELCRIVSTTDDLRAAARATRAIEEITGERIRPLEFEKLEAWWKVNQSDPAYSGDYDGYCNVVARMSEGSVQNAALPDFIAGLSRTIDTEPQALHSMCLKAGFLTMRGELETARGLLANVRKTREDYYWLYVWEGALKVKEGDSHGAVESVNSAFQKSPTSDVENTIRGCAIFAPIMNDPNVNWPRKRHAEKTIQGTSH
jgi:hypothetical protein